MQKIDKIIFGDNQFFGINHMSQEKAQKQAETFFDMANIVKVYESAFDVGIRAIMLNSNDRAKDICDYFRYQKTIYSDINWYPSIPYPHKYANLISEKGMIQTIYDVLFKDNSALGVLGMIAKGGAVVFGRDIIKIMQMLIDIEMKIYHGLNVKVIFLQNIITDLFLGYDLKEIFIEYCAYIQKKYNVLPGFITQNMPILKYKLELWGVEKVVICTSFNKIGYLMSPSIDRYIDAIRNNDSSKFQIMAMSTLASGAIPAKEAYEFINQQKIQSVVFGASSKRHIEETIKLIQI